MITYGQVAAAAGFPGAARLTVRALYGEVGLPWHRVVAAGGKIALTGDDGREQRLRLSMEGVTFRGGRVRMDLHGWVPRARKDRRVKEAKRGGQVVEFGGRSAATSGSSRTRGSRPSPR